MWEQARARFCGHCGAVLQRQVASPNRRWRSRRRDDGRPRRRVGSSRVLAASALGLAVVAVALGAANTSLLGQDEDAGDQTAVDLPDVGDVGNGSGSALEPGCEPVECELWRADLGPGALTTGGGMLFHYSHSDLFHIAEDDVASAGSEEVLTALDLGSGSELWSLELPAAGPDGGFGAHYFGEALLIVSSGQAISSVDPRDGTLLWEQTTPGPIYNPTRNLEGDLVGYGHPNEAPAEMSPDAYADPADGGFVVSLDRQTGEQRWLVGGVSMQGWTEDVAVVRRADGELAGIDLVSGEVAWVHDPEDGTDPWNVTMGTGTVAVSYRASGLDGSSRVVVLDALSGDPIGEADMDVPPDRWFELIGRGLIVTWEEDWTSEPNSGPLTLVDVEHDASPAVIGDVISWTPLGESSVDEWQYGRLGPTTGLAVLTEDRDRISLRVLDANGFPQWEVEFGETGEGCCWSVQRSAYGDGIVVAPPHQDGGSVQSHYAVADGSVTSTQLSARLSAFDHVWWLGELAIGSRPGGVIVEGPAGHFISDEEVMLGVFDPVMVLQTSAGLVAIDHEVLLGDSS